jgi:glycine/D-amino acid oxidase-like deaminating enzyme
MLHRMTLQDTIFAQDFQASPYWWEAAEPQPLAPAAPPEHTPVAIVGGGYAGLSAALTLGRLGHRATVIDAERIGWGASSRNGGMVSGGLKVARGALEKTYGPERAREIGVAAAASFPFIEQLIAREGIDCDYVRCGRFVPAWTRRHYDALATRAPFIAEVTAAAVRMLPAERQREELGSDHYRGGMVVDGAGGLHPGKYARGLRDAAARAGATLLDATRVRRIARAPDGHVLETDRGPIRADAVLVATNGYTRGKDGGSAMPWLARRLVPIGSYIIATEPLGPERIRTLFPTSRMVADTRRLLSYFRPSPDGTRLLWGGRASLAPTTPEQAAPALYRFLTDVFPALAGVRITHAWTGNVAFTFDHLPHIGVTEGVHYAAGCQGSGVAMASWLGHQAALKIAGAANEAFALDGLPFPTRPTYTGNPWFLPLIGEWYRWRDRIDRVAA